MPPAGAGWVREAPAPLQGEEAAPRRSLRARTERTYVDGEDEDEFLASDSSESGGDGEEAEEKDAKMLRAMTPPPPPPPPSPPVPVDAIMDA